jgi:hypothetical protein
MVRGLGENVQKKQFIVLNNIFPVQQGLMLIFDSNDSTGLGMEYHAADDGFQGPNTFLSNDDSASRNITSDS